MSQWFTKSGNGFESSVFTNSNTDLSGDGRPFTNVELNSKGEKLMNKPIERLCLTCILGFLTLILAGCGGGIDVVDAGTYAGTIDNVKADEEEIYLSLDNGMKLELYFTEATQLMKGMNPVGFAELESGDRVEVTVEREGNRNIPVMVVITE